jgi:hypothetical protein
VSESKIYFCLFPHTFSCFRISKKFVSCNAHSGHIHISTQNLQPVHSYLWCTKKPYNQLCISDQDYFVHVVTFQLFFFYFSLLLLEFEFFFHFLFVLLFPKLSIIRQVKRLTCLSQNRRNDDSVIFFLNVSSNIQQTCNHVQSR